MRIAAVGAGANAAVVDAGQLGKGSQDTAVGGSSIYQNNYQMDGASVSNYSSVGDANEEANHVFIGVPNPDSIQEFKIQAGTFDAGYGRNPGASVNVVTKQRRSVPTVLRILAMAKGSVTSVIELSLVRDKTTGICS